MILEKSIKDQMYSSFDVFDTAVTRLVHSPEHIHLLVGRKLRNRGIVTFSDIEWMFIRTQSEFKMRQTVEHNEVNITDIYNMVSSLINIDADLARTALETELDEEIRLIWPISSINRLVSRRRCSGHNVIFVSDTYFPSEFVRHLLYRCGYSDPLDIVCSCEEKKSKIHGTIYDHIALGKHIDSSSFHHLGDNLLSDVQNARARGWNAEGFTDSHWTTRERILAASGDGEFLSSAIAGSARCARLGQTNPVKEGILTASASVVGPMFTAYVLWVLLDVIAHGGTTIYFLARDGQILAHICRRLTRWLNMDVEVRYILASRQAYLLPSLHDDVENIVDEALRMSYYDAITLEEALVSLKFPIDEIEAISKALPFPLHKTSPSLSQEEAAALRAVLSGQDLLRSLRARVREAHAATLAYLDAEGMLSSAEACIVDLGWRGNTQFRLQKLLRGKVRLRGYYMGLTNSVLSPEDCVCRWTRNICLKTGLLEVMASADHTSVKGFVFSAEGQPVCSPLIVEDRVLVEWGARQQQEVALRFCDYLLDAVEPDTFTPQELYQALESAALDAYKHFRMSPTWQEAEAYGSMPHQIDVNHVKFQELAPPVGSLDVIRKILRKKSRRVITSWYMGSIARSASNSIFTEVIHDTLERYFELRARLITRLRRKSRSKHAGRLITP